MSEDTKPKQTIPTPPSMSKEEMDAAIKQLDRVEKTFRKEHSIPLKARYEAGAGLKRGK